MSRHNKIRTRLSTRQPLQLVEPTIAVKVWSARSLLGLHAASTETCKDGMWHGPLALQQPTYSIVVDGSVVLRRVLVNVHLVRHQGWRLGHLQVILGYVGKALGLQGMQVGDVLAWGWGVRRSRRSRSSGLPGRACMGLGQRFVWHGAMS